MSGRLKACGVGSRMRGTTGPETIKKYVGYLPEHLVRRFIAKEGNAVLVTGRLPDVDFEPHPAGGGEHRSRPGSGARAAPAVPPFRHRPAGDCGPQQRAHDLPAQRKPAHLRRLRGGTAGASPSARCLWDWSASCPASYPVVASGAIIQWTGGGLEFASVVALLVVFGLAIDALIHFFNRLSLEERAEPRPEVAIRKARVLVGPAIILNHARAGLRARRDGVFGFTQPAYPSGSCVGPRCWPR